MTDSASQHLKNIYIAVAQPCASCIVPDMIHKAEMDALKNRAHAARISMPDLCRAAVPLVHPQTWYRAYKRGRMEYRAFKRLEDAVSTLEETKP